MSFADIATPTRKSANEYRVVVPENWHQGRGAFGGLVTAWMVNAITDAAGASERVPRSMTAEICGPVMVGEATIKVETFRAGTGVSTLACRLIQANEAGADEVLAHAVIVLGKARTTDFDRVTLAPPVLDTYAATEVAPVRPPFGPEFAQHFEYRPTSALPFSGGTEPKVSGWIRAHDPGAGPHSAASIGALCDAYWPAALTCADTLRPAATIAFTLQWLQPPEAQPADAVFYHRGALHAARDGYTVEFRELWNQRGELIALNQQTIAIIK